MRWGVFDGDIAHIAGWCGGAHPSPFPHAHVVTTTTHRRCAAARRFDLDNDEEMAKRSTRKCFRARGRAADDIIAAKAVAFARMKPNQDLRGADREEREGAGGGLQRKGYRLQSADGQSPDVGGFAGGMNTSPARMRRRRWSGGDHLQTRTRS